MLARSDLVDYSASSTELILDGARMARMAYEDPIKMQKMWQEVVDGITCDDDDTRAILTRLKQAPVYLENPDNDAQGYALVYETAVGPVAVLSFTGTCSFADAIVDSEIKLTPLKSATVIVPDGLLVHSGFLGQFLGLEVQCDAFLKQVNLKDVLCLGHSLGSASSAIAASIYGEKGFAVSHLAYGEPRPGTATWAKFFAHNVQWSVMVKACRDPIPAILPPVCKYTHVGTPLHVGCPDPTPLIPFLWFLPDHDIVNYIAHLKKNDVSPESPKAWIPYIVGLCTNTPVKMYYAIRNFSFM